MRYEVTVIKQSRSLKKKVTNTNKQGYEVAIYEIYHNNQIKSMSILNNQINIKQICNQENDTIMRQL